MYVWLPGSYYAPPFAIIAFWCPTNKSRRICDFKNFELVLPQHNEFLALYNFILSVINDHFGSVGAIAYDDTKRLLFIIS